MASRKWNKSNIPIVGLIDTSLEIANRSADVLQVIVNSLLHPLKNLKSSSDHAPEIEQRELSMDQKRLKRLKRIQGQQHE